ncbi:FAD-binding oxidoreductase [Trinickia caryophylli]|uniref:Gamma-glutamylputrescine oxidase n=1 Tax=Trinickia caryophylli TaxID=28094 RepID=A0A1X7GTU7_TRICW|nr:FAD-binding oxidoreductase [Trinickia caryophylli]PMS09415.1 FAD-binding oxidoreductase [Trinickia caryophylli]TRX18123.1 FAD-binding oxidoreductase [Trinickia caryophylli]WQE11094.1 FAD-binding oxidoreductase [Trinickia caryophylli]SMF74635.1 gamma-glutamylputrescine oxidase [Trinickia caryophylli]GLU35251.1 oxidoreductase [Trinickia caryophylli]
MHTDETPTYYTATRKYDLAFPSLEGDIEAEVVIVGGGFSGIHTALELAERGVTDTVVLEGRHLGYGGTGRNGGQVMAGIGHDLDAIRRDVGDEGLQAIFALSDLGPQIMRERIARYGIDADFRSGYGYLAYNARQAATLKAWEKEFQSLGSPYEIRYLEGRDVGQIIGSDVYHAALLHMGGGHVHSLNLLLGEAKAVSEVYGGRIFEYSPVLEVTYGDSIVARTAKGRVKARKLVWAVDGFNNRIEPALHGSTINVYAYNSVTEPLSAALIERISPIRGAYSDIRPVINYYRVTNDNRLMFGSSTQLIERMPTDLKEWNRRLMLEVFPYLHDVRIDLAWGGPMATTRNLFPQLGTLPGHPNAFFVQGYCGFGVTPSQIICKILAEGVLGGSERYRLLSSVGRAEIAGKDRYRALLVTLGKALHQTSGYWHGRR